MEVAAVESNLLYDRFVQALGKNPNVKAVGSMSAFLSGLDEGPGEFRSQVLKGAMICGHDAIEHVCK